MGASAALQEMSAGFEAALASGGAPGYRKMRQGVQYPSCQWDRLASETVLFILPSQTGLATRKAPTRKAPTWGAHIAGMALRGRPAQK